LPYRALIDQNLDVDGVVVYTDSETWAGQRGHPSQVLDEYRRKVGHEVRNVIASMTATSHSIGDPDDPLTLQCVGLDASLPQTISQFMAGEF
jgi:60 kDa SS-A/Ro ribonucleoprotein